MTLLDREAQTAARQQAMSPDAEKNRARSRRIQRSGQIAAVLIVATVALSVGLALSLSIGAGWRAFTVHGGSMQPHFAQGDLIVTSAANASRVKPGQIIVFSADWASEKYERRVVHRVAAVGTIGNVPIAYTRGDANDIADPQPVDLTGNDVKLVRFSVPNGAFWLDVLTAPYALALAVTVTMSAIVVLALSAGFTPLGLGHAYWSITPVPTMRRPRATEHERASQRALRSTHGIE